MECYDHMGQDQDKCGYCEIISEHDREIARLTAEREAALKEQDRLAKAWEAKHAYQVEQSKDLAEYFDKSQRRMQELVAERDEARAEAAAAYERAAEACADYPRVAPDETEWPHYDDQIAHSQALIRALATEADTTTLDRIVKQAVDAETRACAEICNGLVHAKQQRHGYKTAWGAMGCRKAIIARIDQRKKNRE